MLENMLIFLGVLLILTTYLFEKAKPEISGKGMIILGIIKILAGILIIIGLLRTYL